MNDEFDDFESEEISSLIKGKQSVGTKESIKSVSFRAPLNTE